MEDRITPPAAPARRTSTKCGKYRVDAKVALKAPRPCLQHGGCCLHPSYAEIALQLLEERGEITVAELASAARCKYRTASAALRDLISSKNGRPIGRRVARGRYALNLPENGAPRSESITEVAPSAGGRQPADGLCGERGIRTPDTLAGTPDFESGTSPRAAQAVRLAWELVGKETAPRLAAWFLEQLDEHDPLACEAICCNAPLAIEVRS